jgi:signal peptidase I
MMKKVGEPAHRLPNHRSQSDRGRLDVTTKHLRTIAKWVVRVFLVGFLGLIAFAVTILIVLPRATHGTALTVLTGSMTPEIPVGSVVIDRPVDPGTLHVGDIATYQKAPGVNEYITHRIVAINTKTNPVTFTFKGDANRGPDMNPVPATAIRGKVWFHVAYLGAIRDSLQSHGSRGLAILAAVLGLAGFACYQVVSAVRERRAGTPLVMTFDRDVFDAGEADLIARLFHGESVVDDDTGAITMTFPVAKARQDLIRGVLDEYRASAATEPVSVDA